MRTLRTCVDRVQHEVQPPAVRTAQSGQGLGPGPAAARRPHPDPAHEGQVQTVCPTRARSGMHQHRQSKGTLRVWRESQHRHHAEARPGGGQAFYARQTLRWHHRNQDAGAGGHPHRAGEAAATVILDNGYHGVEIEGFASCAMTGNGV